MRHGALELVYLKETYPHGINIKYFFDKDIERAENLASFAGGVGDVQQMAFDYAGNLVVAGTSVKIYSIPLENNQCTTPAKRSLTIIKQGQSHIAGDVNCDGSVTSADITELYNYLLNGSMTYHDTSDVNGDGNVTAADVTEVYSIILGN